MHTSQTHTLHFHAAIDTVFPLFTPEEEAKWLEGWEPNLLFSDPGQAGTVFSTSHPHLPDMLWVQSRFDTQDHLIQYVRFAPGHHVAVLDLVASGHTQLQVTYTLTSLSEAGEQYLRDEFSPEAYLHRMHQWQDAVTRYLAIRPS